MKPSSIAALLACGLFIGGAASASEYLVLEKSRTTADYSLPEPLRTAHLEISGARLSVNLAGRDVAVDNQWLGAIPGLDLDSAMLARGSSGGAELYVLIACRLEGHKESGMVVLEIRDFVVVGRTIDGCASV